MLIALIALLVIILVMAVLYVHMHNKFDKRVRYWAGIAAGLQVDLAVSENSYKELDKGMVEITDAYESDSLQYEETIEKLNQEKARFAENNSTLLHNAMIDRAARHAQEKTIHQLREEVLHVKRQLDIAQVVISEHDLNCLPHIVLSSMEHHKDEALPGI